MKKVKAEFLKRYEDEWDYSHQNLEKGDIFVFFLKEKGYFQKYRPLLSKETFPIHLSDVPEELSAQYKDYIKGYLQEYLDYSRDNELFSQEYTLERALEEFAACMDLEDVD